MHFSALAALVSTLSALASATPTPDLSDAELEKPAVAPLADLYGPWNDSISSVKILSPALGICGFHKATNARDRDCRGPYFTIDYLTPVDDVQRYAGFNEQIGSFLCTGIVE
ncbi:hypothetical protein VE01_08087 [Pseudogymnoascus verrucosus]|uniref:Uncharacterized protein n=1 Tax=Pseudogymnoascus verrucosus TaxID=342668 RepID=A0A1B8GD45_9PEZI|nr:uncharacterized protein VE01_08087 [Pseudogymnoascus verrucosus]OBT93707.1 hypothetical protein VE01_08087 [Pseudogymnoascus verrucosus]